MVKTVALAFFLSAFAISARSTDGDVWACMTCAAHCQNDPTCVANNCKDACSTSARPAHGPDIWIGSPVPRPVETDQRRIQAVL